MIDLQVIGLIELKILSKRPRQKRKIPRKTTGPNPELIIRKYIEESVNHFLGETVRIEVEYKPEPATNAILYDFVGKNVSVQKLENGNCRAVFYKMNSVTLLGWFMKYMDKFMVIEPQMLRENIKTKLENTLEIMNNINGSQ